MTRRLPIDLRSAYAFQLRRGGVLMTPAFSGCRILTAALNNVLRRFSHDGWTRIFTAAVETFPIKRQLVPTTSKDQILQTSAGANDPQKLGGMALTSDDGKRNSRVANDDQDGTPNWLPYTQQATQRSCPGRRSNRQTGLVPKNCGILLFG